MALPSNISLFVDLAFENVLAQKLNPEQFKSDFLYFWYLTYLYLLGFEILQCLKIWNTLI